MKNKFKNLCDLIIMKYNKLPFVFFVFICVFYLYKSKTTIIESFSSLIFKGPNIIQTWKDNNLPKKYKLLVDNVIKLNPYSNYMFFTDKDIDKFIKNKYPQYLKIFYNLPFTIQKIDFFRYLAVYYFGGVYLDLDILLFKSVKNVSNDNKAVFPLEFSKNSDIILQKQGFNGLIGNYAFYSPKEHPFLEKIINNIINKRIKISKPNNNDNRKYVYYTTGPVIVTQSYIDLNFKNSVKIIEPYPFKKSHFGDYGKHVKFGTWK